MSREKIGNAIKKIKDCERFGFELTKEVKSIIYLAERCLRLDELKKPEQDYIPNIGLIVNETLKEVQKFLGVKE
jgi:hypothetical protein